MKNQFLKLYVPELRFHWFFVIQKWACRPLRNPSSFFLYHAWGVSYWGRNFDPQKSRVPLGFLGFWTDVPQQGGASYIFFSRWVPVGFGGFLFLHAQGFIKQAVEETPAQSAPPWARWFKWSRNFYRSGRSNLTSPTLADGSEVLSLWALEH